MFAVLPDHHILTDYGRLPAAGDSTGSYHSEKIVSIPFTIWKRDVVQLSRAYRYF
jgi:hypothetical protein